MFFLFVVFDVKQKWLFLLSNLPIYINNNLVNAIFFLQCSLPELPKKACYCLNEYFDICNPRMTTLIVVLLLLVCNDLEKTGAYAGLVEFGHGTRNMYKAYRLLSYIEILPTFYKLVTCRTRACIYFSQKLLLL